MCGRPRKRSAVAPASQQPSARSMDNGIVKLECTLRSFVPADDGRVRWLEHESVFDLVQEAWRASGTSVNRDDWNDWQRQGYRFCGIVEDQRLVASAAVWAYSAEAW